MFWNCYDLESVKLPANLEHVTNYMFANCHKLSGVVIPENVQSIGFASFAECYALTSITIPASIEWIEGRAFWKDSNLASVTFEGTETEFWTKDIFNTGEGEGEYEVDLGLANPKLVINAYADSDAAAYAELIGVTPTIIATTEFVYSLRTVETEDENGETVVSYGAILNKYNGSDAEVVVPATCEIEGTDYLIVEIGDKAFEGNTTLTSIDLPDTVDTIGVRAFADCTSLTSMT